MDKEIRYGRTQRLIPQNEVEEIADMYNQGYSVAEVVIKTEYTEKKVLAVIHQLGIVRKKGSEITVEDRRNIENLYLEGKMLKDISAELDVTIYWVRRVLIEAGYLSKNLNAYVTKTQEEIEFEQAVAENKIKFAKKTLKRPQLIECNGKVYQDVTVPLMQSWEYGLILGVRKE